MRPDFLWVVFGRIATALISVVSLRITTTLFEPSIYGQLALLGAFQSFCGLFLINPIGQHINRLTHSWWDEGKLLYYLVSYNSYIRAVSLFILVVVAFWWNYHYAENSGGFIISFAAGSAVAAMVYLGTWNGTLVPLLNMLGFRSQSVILMVATASVSLICATGLVLQQKHALLWMFGQIFGLAVGAGWAWRILRHHALLKKQVSHQTNSLVLFNKKILLDFCLPLAMATGFMWLQTIGYRFWVDSVFGADELGILMVGLGISAQLWVILESFAIQFLYPYFYRHITHGQSDQELGAALSDMISLLLPIYAIFAGLNAVCATALLQLLTNERYHIATPFVVLGAVIEFSRCVTNLWSGAAQAKRETKRVILPYGLGAFVVWLGAIGTSYFSTEIMSLVLVLILSGLVTLISMVVSMQRLLPISIDMGRTIIGLVIMVTCFLAVIAFPYHPNGLYQNLALLLVAGTMAALLMLSMLWRNPALSRLISVSLRSA